MNYSLFIDWLTQFWSGFWSLDILILPAGAIAVISAFRVMFRIIGVKK